jgi:parallel beta-helix repeat protein
MSSLANQQQNLSFPGLLQVPGGITSTLQQVQDGNGNLTALSISTSGSSIATASNFIATEDGTAITGVVSRLISDGFGDLVSVKDFGATGDGTTDDTSAFTAAAVYSSANKVRIFIPSGTYIVGYIACPSYTSFVGNGAKNTTLKLKASTNNSIFGGGTSDYLNISNIGFDLNPTQNTGTPAPGVSLSGVEFRSYAQIYNCLFFGMQSAGAWGYGSYNNIYNNSFIQGGYTNLGGAAVYITSATGASYNVISGNTVIGISYGFCVINTGTVGVSNEFLNNTGSNLSCEVTSYAQSAVVNAWECSRTIISGNNAYFCNGPGIRLISKAEESIVTNNIVQNCGLSGTAGIDIGDSAYYLDKGLVISNNISCGCGGPGFWLTSVYNSTISNNISNNNGIIVVPPPGWVTDFYIAGFVLASEADSAATPVENNVFSGNVCTLNNYAISRTGAGASVIVANTHIGNKYSGNFASPYNYAPSTDYYVGNDTGTGIDFNIAGSNGLYVSPTNTVGIGTTTPPTTLSLYKSAGAGISLNDPATYSNISTANSGITYFQIGSSQASGSTGQLNFTDILNTKTWVVLDAQGNFLLTGAGNLGYSTGSGGAVTQTVSRTSGVTLNKPSGAITLYAGVGSASDLTFTVTNSKIASTDTVIVSVKSSTSKYNVFISAVTTGAFDITYYATTIGASDTPVLNYTVIKGAVA